MVRLIALGGLSDCFDSVQVIEAAKKRGQEKAKLTKSMIVLDVKPWDDTTGELKSTICHTSQTILPTETLSL